VSEGAACGLLRWPAPPLKRNQHQPNQTSDTRAGARRTQRMLMLTTRTCEYISVDGPRQLWGPPAAPDVNRTARRSVSALASKTLAGCRRYGSRGCAGKR